MAATFIPSDAETNRGDPANIEPDYAPERQWRSMPQEGDDGLFTQSWFPICTTSELGVGEVIGRDFLDGRVVVFRGQDGIAQVTSAYCAHVGADLSVGSVESNSLVCRFHRWRYDRNGNVEATGVGDPAPKRACLFRFPTVERWGLIWAFNGTKPLWDLPDLRYPDEELFVTVQYCYPFNADPWVFAANTFDFAHFELLHGLKLDRGYPTDIRWTPYNSTYDVMLKHWGGKEVQFTYGTYGSNIFFSQGEYEGRWYANIGPRTLQRPGRSEQYLILLSRRDPSMTDAEHQAFHDHFLKMETEFAEQDRTVLETIRFKQGYLTRSDKTLGRFLDYIRNYPRAHPSAKFIR